MGAATSPVQMGSAHSAAAAMNLSSVSPDPPTSSQSGVERRAGSSRIRRPPKRLLSPPANRPQQQSASHSSSHDRGMLPGKVDDALLSPKESSPSAIPKAARPRSKSSRQSTKLSVDDTPSESIRATQASSACSSTSDDVEIVGESADSGDTGPGKRKRKPSTMIKPPSTITHTKTPSSASLPASSSGRSSILKSAKARHSTGSCLKKPHLPSLDENSTYSAGYESDGGKAAADLDTDIEGMHEADEYEQPAEGFDPDHLEAPPLIFQRNGACLLKSKSGARADNKSIQQTKKRDSSSQSNKAKRRISTSPSHETSSRTVASPPTAQYKSFTGTRFVHHLRTQSMPSISQMTPWGCRSLHRASAGDKAMMRSVLPNAIDVESDSDGDEDDFHRTMLDSDFEELDSWTRLSDFDTPATTPRSPQSSCGQLDTNDTASTGETTSTSRSSLSESVSTQPGVRIASVAKKDSVSENDVTENVPEGPSSPQRSTKVVTPVSEGLESADRNTVFAHALPPSDRPKDQDGLRLLSLPFGDLKSFTSPHALKDGLATSRFTTPTLERMASRENIHVNAPLDSSPSDGKGKRNAVVDVIKASGDAEEGVTSTSPTLSPTQTVFSLVPIRGSHETGDDDTSGSVIASPFLAAIRQHGIHEGELSSSASRAVSPAPFRLPAAAGTTTQPNAPVKPETHSESRSEDGPVGHREASERHTARRSSASSDGRSTVEVDGELGAAPHERLSEEESTFSLPETMALDEIDAAYGGSSQAPGKLTSVRESAETVEKSESAAGVFDDAVAFAGADAVSSNLERPTQRVTTPSSKRSLRESSVDSFPAVEASADRGQDQDGLEQATEDDSPRPRKVTRSRTSSGVVGGELSSESNKNDVTSSPSRRSARRSTKAGRSGMSSDDEQEATDGQSSPSKLSETERPARTRSSRVIRRPVK